MIFERVIGSIHRPGLGAPRPDFTVELDWPDCYRRATRVTLAGGTRAGILLPLGTVVRDGDLLTTTNDAPVLLLHVRPVQLLVAHIADAREMGLACAALGNHHLPLEVGSDRLVTIDDGLPRQVFRELGLRFEGRRDVFHPTRSSVVGVIAMAGSVPASGIASGRG